LTPPFGGHLRPENVEFLRYRRTFRGQARQYKSGA
jgi:hypothetical protein